MTKHITESLAKVISRWPQEKIDKFKLEMRKKEPQFNLPEDDLELVEWAKEYRYPMPDVKEFYPEYRRRLEQAVEQRMREMK